MSEQEMESCFHCGGVGMHYDDCSWPSRPFSESYNPEKDALATIAALEAALTDAERKLAAWHEAMTDVSVVNWTLAEDNAEDLHKQLLAVIAQNVQEQLDPVVSEQAKKLQDAERERDEAQSIAIHAATECDVAHDEIMRLGRALQDAEAALTVAREALERVMHSCHGYGGVAVHSSPCAIARAALAQLRQPATASSEVIPNA